MRHTATPEQPGNAATTESETSTRREAREERRVLERTRRERSRRKATCGKCGEARALMSSGLCRGCADCHDDGLWCDEAAMKVLARVLRDRDALHKGLRTYSLGTLLEVCERSFALVDMMQWPPSPASVAKSVCDVVRAEYEALGDDTDYDDEISAETREYLQEQDNAAWEYMRETATYALEYADLLDPNWDAGTPSYYALCEAAFEGAREGDHTPTGLKPEQFSYDLEAYALMWNERHDASVFGCARAAVIRRSGLGDVL